MQDTYWMVKNEKGFYLVTSVRWTKEDAIEAYLEVLEDIYYPTTWEEAESSGFKCVEIKITEI